MAEIVVKLGDQIIQTYPITKDAITIGRARDNEIVVENLSVSRNHARIRFEAGKFTLTDLNSANGSFLNGVKVTQAEIKDNDIISIGKHKLHFTAGVNDALGAESGTESVSDEHAPFALDKPAVPHGATPRDSSPSARLPVVQGIDSWGYLLVTRGKQSNVLFRLGQDETIIGRANENDIRLHDWFVSKKHAVIIHDADGFLVRDLGSWRGITLNGAPVREARLSNGDELVFGTTVVKFHIGPEDYRIEGAVLSTELASDVQVPEAPDALSGAEPEDYEGQLSDRTDREIGDRFADENPSLDGISSEDLLADEDDEYAPLTDEELADLERETDEALSGISERDGESDKRAQWEQLEADRLIKEGGGWRKSATEMDAADDAALSPADSHSLLDDPEIAGDIGVDQEDHEEENGLFGGPVSNIEPGALDSPRVDTASRSSGIISTPSSLSSTAIRSIDVPEGVDPTEFRKWSRGLRNKSRIVRREAARKLKELTGIDYEWESDPE